MSALKRRPSTVDHWRFQLVDDDQTELLYRLTSARLSFCTGWRRPVERPDWAFLLVDVDQTKLLFRSTSTRLSFSTGRRRPLSYSTGRRWWIHWRCRRPFGLMFSSRPTITTNNKKFLDFSNSTGKNLKIFQHEVQIEACPIFPTKRGVKRD